MPILDVICFDILTDQVAKKLAEKGRKLSLTQDDQSSKTKLRHSQSYSFESHGNFIYPWESAIFFYSGIQSWKVLEKKKILTFDTWNKSNVINRMLIWSLCVKGLLFILYHNQNGSKIEIVSSVYDDLNNFLMEKAFD